jgi:tetratricopeptide (TPR) repeat protein
MPDSAFTRFWNNLKPLPKENRPPISPEVAAMRRRQRKLIYITVGVVALMGAGAYIFNYIATAPQRAEKEYLEGMKSMRPSQYPAAVAHFTRAIDIKAQYPEAFLERANAHRVLSETDAALADYQAAADLNSSLVAAHNGIAMIYLERKDSRHALEELNKSLSLQPDTDAFYQRGEIYEAQGEHQKAIDDYDRAIANQRDAPFIYLARALAKQNLGDKEGALADRITAARISRHF